MPERPELTLKLKGLPPLDEPPTRVAGPAQVPDRTSDDACLVRIHPPGPTVGRRYPLGPTPAVVGRATSCDVIDPDPSVSREHARIEPAPGGGFRVADLGSTNGTFVNHAPVDATPLADGDYVRLGTSIYRFLAGGNLEAAYHEEIHRLAVTDPLTGLPNRRALTEFLEREADRARRKSQPLSVLLLDVDRFKSVNDRFGHVAGDDVLRGVATALAPLVRKDELLARYGGEEFAAVLPGADAGQAWICAERLRAAIEAHKFHADGHELAVTVSVGAASAAGHAASAAGLLECADERLYAAKRAGRNRVVS